MNERRSELLARQRWTLAEFLELTGWSRFQLYRWRRALDIAGGKWIYAHQLHRDGDLHTWMRGDPRY